MSDDGESPEFALAAQVLARLKERGQTVAVAESLTGGLVAAALTGAPGASGTFLGSVTAYATELKHQLLGVDAALLEERGAVDPEVARQLAAGVRERLGADWGLATTGVAGPARQDGRPVGTVFVAVCGPGDREASAQHLSLSGDRAGIRSGSVCAVLEHARKKIEECSTNRSEPCREGNTAAGPDVYSPE
ncbi:CinA family protein [Streptomyces sp. ACA25]|uniref:CinA family protein n=1 Tax=Streptomyces sp. ACA25 TaxID=3022596 RepID=UPI00230706EC|nr:CinA family protein [Streptomyces sp. ACA25]MDB1088859.1 CinA family protein [Streptomyces sp. ACA25]